MFPSQVVITPWHPFVLGHCGPVSTASPPPPDIADLRGLAHGLRQLFEIAASTLADDAQPSELARRVTSHLGCELTATVPVTERFSKWEHVNVQRRVDACLAARQNEMAESEPAPHEPEWFGTSSAACPCTGRRGRARRTQCATWRRA